MNSAAINLGVQLALLYLGLHSFGYMPKSSITGWYGSSTSSYFVELHTAFHSVCTNLHSHQQWIKIPFPWHLTSIFCLCY
jgi:hypothetical protein